MSQIPGVVADLASQLLDAVHPIAARLDRIRRDGAGGEITPADAQYLCDVQRKIVDLTRLGITP